MRILLILAKKFFSDKIFFSFSNVHTRKIKPGYITYEVNTIPLFETIPPKNQTISIH